MVLPLLILSTSPGLVARPEGMFSAAATIADDRHRDVQARPGTLMAASTAAAPDMSVFMSPCRRPA